MRQTLVLNNMMWSQHLHIRLSPLLSIRAPATMGEAGRAAFIGLREGASTILLRASLPLPLVASAHQHSGALGGLQRTVHLGRGDREG